MKQYSIDQLFKMRWEDLTTNEILQVIAITDQLTQHAKDTTEYGYLVIQMLRLLRKNKSAVAKINEEQAVDCFNDIAFFQKNDKGQFITPWLFFPVAVFKIGGVKFVRPEVNGHLPMYNRIFDQLVFADSAFSAFCVLNHQYQQLDENDTTRAELSRSMDDAVNSLIAILYTEPSQFDVVNVETHARLVPLKLNQAKRAIILHTYSNARNYITQRCPNLFPKHEEDEGNTTPELTGPMWLNLRFDLAETKQFQGFDTARKALIYDALDLMEKKALENQQQKETAHAQG